jgi:hypothetical protein
MYTTAVLVALSSLAANGELVPQRPAWLNDYAFASQRGIAQQRPLAVFIGTGEGGWKDVSTDRSLGAEVKEMLTNHYVCVYIDTRRKEGRDLARAFDVGSGVGLVISDRAGKLQAFHHDGELKSSELRSYLRRYANHDRMVVSTETREDLQPRPAPPPPPPPPPVMRYAPIGRGC